ncbi:MAG TPA: glycosyltransferase family 2 protein [Bacteroidales bacterium]|nr:glycosyltransferase family 2 protein [Bacteroidales bacterium]
MKIEAYILAHNEELLMPYIVRHYSQFADVIILENNSTDRTIEIAHNMGATVWKYEIPDTMDTQLQTEIKNVCWHGSKADWIIIVDADEFVYHPDIINVLENTKATVIEPKMFNMFSDKFPTTEGQIYDEVTMGTEYRPPPFNYTPDHLEIVINNQVNLFNAHEIEDIHFTLACHYAYPKGNVILDKDSGIKTLHMKYLSIKYVLERQQRYLLRRSKNNNFSGAGLHYKWSKKNTIKYINEMKATAIKIV